MVQVIEAVQKNESTIRDASEIYEVANSLHDRISGKVAHGVCSGPECYLSNTEENSLEVFAQM